MSKHLEDFVKNNREEFDKFEPGPVVWNNIQQQLRRPADKQGILISMRTLRWSAAAAILVLLGAGAWFYLSHNKTSKQENIARVKEKPASNDLPVVTAPAIKNETPLTAQNVQPNKTNQNIQPAAGDDPDAEYNEELVHYTRLVELKQHQIKRIQKDEPLLYRQFAGDFNRLDSTFHILKKQLPKNPNREQILEAMIQNLQYQEALLNQQLNIIKKINNTKKQAYENAYKSV